MAINSLFNPIKPDESTDESNKPFFCFVRVECEGELQEGPLRSLNVLGRTISSEIFKALGSYFLKYRIELKECTGICMGDAGELSHAWILSLSSVIKYYSALYRYLVTLPSFRFNQMQRFTAVRRNIRKSVFFLLKNEMSS